MSEVSNSDLRGFPYSAIGLIRATFSDGTTQSGVGSVIGKNDVITALSLIYNPDLGWATAIDFYFGADYNVNTGKFDNVPQTLTSNYRWESTGYTSQLFADSDNSRYFQSEAQYNIAVIGLSEEIGLRTGWLGLDPNRDSNSQQFSTVGFSGSEGMVSFQTTVDKSSTAGLYISESNPFSEQNNLSSGSPLFTSDNYLVGVRSTTNWWADIGFIYSFITSAISDNDDLLTITSDNIPPTLSSMSPADESTGVAIDSNLILTFSETIIRGTGTLALKNSSGTIIESFNIATSSRVTISGSTLTINPTSDLAYFTGHQLEIPSGAIKDVSGNSYEGFSSYNFTTTWEEPIVSIEDSNAYEGNSGSRDLIFEVSLSTPSPEDVTLTVRTWRGTASTWSRDYNGFDERVFVIPAGQVSFNLPIEINGDDLFEPNEGFVVEILRADGAVLGDTLAQGWIIDDDEPYPLPSDTYARYQWHLYPEIGANVFPVWTTWTGKDVKVGVFDQGIDQFHSDLDGNLLTDLGRDASTLAAGGSPRTGGDNHGTAVAGVIAAERDGRLTVGIAPNASLVSIYTPFGVSTYVQDIVNAFTYAKNLDVLNDSWGFAPQRYSSEPWAFFDDFNSTRFRPAYLALKDLADNGRNGLGTIVVQSAGNSFSLGDDTNLHNFQNSRYIVTVAATNYSGDASAFSTQGASILVSAPGGGGGDIYSGGVLGEILTTDRVGSLGNSKYDYDFTSGTSFSAPVVSGVVALMLEANPSLGYRDVQLILAYSARQIASDGNEWRYNGAENLNGGGLHYDSVIHNLGFGMVDALAAVRLAETWTGMPLTSQNVTEVYASLTQPVEIPDDSLITQSISIDKDIIVERVELNVEISHTFIGDLAILLTSPSGTNSWMLWKPGESAQSPYGSTQDNIDFTFNTVLSMGESSVGVWELTIFDLQTGDVGSLNSWSINIVGRNDDDDDVFFYSNEFSEALLAEGSRAILTDTSGVDLLNASMVTSALRLDLNPGGLSTIDDAQLTISDSTLIENAIGGDGDDYISGNVVANELRGMRGNDQIFGLAGNDTISGGDGDDLIYGGAGDDELDHLFSNGDDKLYGGLGNDSYFVYSHSGADTFVEKLNEGNDVVYTSLSYSLSGIENIENLFAFSTITIDLQLAGNELDNWLRPSSGNCILDGGLGNDTAWYGWEYAYEDCFIYIENGDLKVRKGNGSIDILKNFEYVAFSDRSINLSTASITSLDETYSISAVSSTADEGKVALFSLVTTNLVAGTSVPYTLSGISASDLVSNSLTGTATVSATGTTVISLPLTADALTEGAETLTITVDDSPDTTASLTIIDTSISPSYRLSAVYDFRDEGSTAYFSLVTNGIDAGTSVAYTISGVSASDLVSGSLNGTVTTAAAGLSKLISIPIRKDNLTEGDETLTITLDDSSSTTASLTINDTSEGPTYSITPGSESYDEGQSALFSLATTNLAAGTSIAYTVSGVSASDLVSNSLTGTATVSATGTTVISLPLTADALTEGAETLTITVDDSPDATASLMINDSSKTPVVDVTLYRTTILGDKNILGPDPVLIKALTENITKTDGVISEHFFLYAGARYDYSDIDSLITVVARNGEFTDEFSREISDYASSLANATYSDVVQIVGSSGIDGWLIKVAGDDGNYIG